MNSMFRFALVLALAACCSSCTGGGRSGVADSLSQDTSELGDTNGDTELDTAIPVVDSGDAIPERDTRSEDIALPDTVVQSDGVDDAADLLDGLGDTQAPHDIADAVEDTDTVADTLVLPPRPVGERCSSSADCTGSTPFCDPMYGVCVACIVGNDCDKLHYCSNYQCLPKPGPPCYTQADCNPRGFLESGIPTSPTPYCKPRDRYCVQCIADFQCGTGERCKDYECVSTETRCVRDSDCPGGPVGQYCRVAKYGTLSWCVECVTDADCAEGKTCDPVQLNCKQTAAPLWSWPSSVACDADEDCRGTGLRCDTVGHVCAQCGFGIACPENYHCSRGNCVPNEDCRAGQQRCVRPCRDLGTCTIAVQQPVGAIQTCGPTGRWADATITSCGPVTFSSSASEIFELGTPEDCIQVSPTRAECKPQCVTEFECLTPDNRFYCLNGRGFKFNRCVCDLTKWRHTGTDGCRPTGWP